MPNWKVRSPDIFPLRLADVTLEAVRTGEPTKLGMGKTRKDVEAVIDQYRFWRYCLRERGGAMHRGYQEEQDYRLVTKAVKLNDEYVAMVTALPRIDWLELVPDLKNYLA